MKKHWSALDHQVWKILKENQLTKSKFLICVSGGADSTALLQIFTKIHQPELIRVFHYHHGPGENIDFRDQAQSYVADLCRKKNLNLILGRSQSKLNSEMEYREARMLALKEIRLSDEIVVTGHHCQDLLETRLLRLIRGTGSLGLRSMSVYKTSLLRPLLNLEPKDLKDYLKFEGVQWLEDPTNTDHRVLRNWVRNIWLPKLEQKRKGSVKSLARSLESICESLTENKLIVPHDNKLMQSYYMSCSQNEQKELLSKWLYNLGVRSYSRGQIEEIQKQLSRNTKNNVIKIGPIQLKVNAQQILLIRS